VPLPEDFWDWLRAWTFDLLLDIQNQIISFGLQVSST